MTPASEKAKTGRGARPTDQQSVERRSRLDEWQRGLTDQVVGNILHYRDKRGLSNDDLRARLAVLDWELTKDSLASVLSGSSKRKVMPLGDVFLFALALNVPPIALVVPLHLNDPVALAPVSPDIQLSPTSAFRAAQWFAGKDGDVDTRARFAQDADTLDDYYSVGDLVGRLEDYKEYLGSFNYLNAALIADLHTAEERKALLKSALEALDDLTRQRRFLKVTNPELALEPLRAPLGFIDSDGRIYPTLPLIGYSTDAEILSVKGARTAGTPSVPPA